MNTNSSNKFSTNTKRKIILDNAKLKKAKLEILLFDLKEIEKQLYEQISKLKKI